MEKEIRTFVAAISTLGLLAGCSETGTIEAKKDDTSVPTQNIRPFVDHDVLARRYENRARKLLEIAAELEKRLQYYEDKSYLYERHRQDSHSRTTALVQKYKLVAEKAPKLFFTTGGCAAPCETRLYCFDGVHDLDCPRNSAEPCLELDETARLDSVAKTGITPVLQGGAKQHSLDN